MQEFQLKHIIKQKKLIIVLFIFVEIVRRKRMVSLIIPCYNSEKYIGRCLESVLKQSDKDIELILVNDGSTDNSAHIINEYRYKLEHVLTKFVYLEQDNQGVGAACNNAFKKVTGEYLILLDSDDIILPDCILEDREWLDKHPTFGFVRTNGYYVTEDDLDSNERLLEVNDYMKTKENVFDELFNGSTYLWPGTYMIRMSVLDDLYPDREIYPSRSGQNLQFVMMAAYKSKAGFIDKPLMKYLVRKESLSHFSSGDILKKEIAAMEGYKDIRKYLIKKFMPKDEQNEWNNRIDRLYAKVHLNLAVKYRDREFAKQCYRNIKKLYNGLPELNLQLTYYKMVNPLKYYYLRLLRKFGYVE